jgi:hypothetical protein
LGGLLEFGELALGFRVVPIVGARQVGHQADFQRGGLEVAEALEGLWELTRPKAQAIHAGVYFDPEQEALWAGALFEQLDLEFIVDHQVESVTGGFQQVLGGEDAFQQDNGLGDAGGSEGQALFQASDSKSISVC